MRGALIKSLLVVIPLLALVAVLETALKPLSAFKSSDSIIDGEHLTFSNRPTWTVSGTWSSDGERLFLIDTLENKVLEYDRDGHMVNNNIAERGAKLPALINQGPKGFLWLEDEDGLMLLTDDNLAVTKKIDLKAKVVSPLGSLLSVSSWAPSGSNALLVFGDLKRKQGDTGAILRVPLQDPSKFDILKEVPTTSPAHRFFLVGQQYMTSVGDRAFYAVMNNTPEIFDSNGKGFRLVSKTANGKMFLPIPRLPTQVTMSSTPVLYKRLEKAFYPAGIYGGKKSLFVLVRIPKAKGSDWSLIKINTTTFGVIWNRRIASCANFLVVVPGAKYWAFVEKGPVKGPGLQSIRSFLRVPAELIEE